MREPWIDSYVRLLSALLAAIASGATTCFTSRRSRSDTMTDSSGTTRIVVPGSRDCEDEIGSMHGTLVNPLLKSRLGSKAHARYQTKCFRKRHVHTASYSLPAQGDALQRRTPHSSSCLASLGREPPDTQLRLFSRYCRYVPILLETRTRGSKSPEQNAILRS